MREIKREKRNFKYMAAVTAAVLLAVVLALIYSGFSIWREYKQAIISNQKQQMLLTAQSLADNLEVLIEEYEADLDGLCEIAARQSKTGDRGDWSVFKEYAVSHRRFVHDVVLEDEKGQVIKSTGPFRIDRTFSVSRLDDRRTLAQSSLDDGELYLILKMRLDSGNTVSIVIDGTAYYRSLISGIRLGTNGYVVVKDSKGIILMHPDKAQWGIDVIAGREDLYPGKDLSSLEEMIARQNRGEEGVSEYYSYWWTKPGAPKVKKISAYSPADIGEDFLVVSAVIDYDDIYIPIAEGFLKMVMVFAGILSAILALGAFMASLLLQKRKDTEEIEYLTELNRLLAEMHQSEEVIAHQQRLQIMGTMTGGIAHEFNNLLTPIMGYADLLMMELPEDSEEFDNASEIYEASAKAKEIIQQISSLSRKNMETAFKNLNAARVIGRALKMVQSVCPGNVRLESCLELKEQCFLGNETQFNQVILNICVNAIHAIGHEDGRISVKGLAVDRSELLKYNLSSVPDDWAGYIRIDVEDNGCGMGEDVLKQIFDPFFTTKKGGKGTGLGLALAEQIISSHKGYIFAESVPGQGSIFHIYLPVNEQGEEKGTGTAKQEGAPELRLLLVDDNPKVLQLLGKNFGKLGIPAVPAMDFEEARTLLGGREFDAVAAEQFIEGKSAVDFCMSIQGLYPGLVKIIMADRMTKELAEARQRGIIDAYIDKPVSDASIVKAVQEARREE